jgi:hypothetical protein
VTYYLTNPYTTPLGSARFSSYGFSGTPSVIFDGVSPYVGGAASGSMYSTYQPTVAARRTVSSPLVMAASYKIRGDQVTITLDASLTAAVAAGNTVQFLVCLDGYHGHPNLVMSTLASEVFTPVSSGQSQQVTRTFTLDPAWSTSQLSLIMFVQNNTTKAMLQAIKATPAYEATVTMDCEPNGVAATWHMTGPYETRTGNGDAVLQLFDAGQYTVTWDPTPYWTGPAAPQVVTIPLHGNAMFSGTYTGGPFTARTSGGLAAAGQSRAGSLVDFDEDGDLDVHVVRNTEADLLLRNDGASGFTNVATGPLADTGAGTGSAWADINGDGHLDVYVTRANQANLLLRGDGAGVFTAITAYGAGIVGPVEGANWVDYNLDGKLDLYVFQNNTASTSNSLLTSLGDIGGGTWLFSGLQSAMSTTGNTSACSWTDGDLDGRLDAYVVRRYGTNQLFQNLSIGFNEMTPGSGLSDTGSDAGAAWGDFDNDGDFDLYIAIDGGADKLYRCISPFHFELVTGPNLGDAGHARGVSWADLDNDGRLDLYVPRYNEPDLVLLGDGAGGFTRVQAGIDETVAGSNGVAAGDLDGDGRVDLFVPRTALPNVVLTNGLVTTNHWFKLRLTGGGANTSAIGARVVLTAGGVAQSRLLTSGGGLGAVLEQHFGLGANTGVDQIDIYWPSGLHQVVTPKPADITLKVTEGQAPVVSGVPGEVPAALTVLGAAHPNPFNPSTTIAFTLGTAGQATLSVYTVDGRLVRTLLDGAQAAGPHAVTWDGRDEAGRAAASGAYFYRLSTAGFMGSGRMTLVK